MANNREFQARKCDWGVLKTLAAEVVGLHRRYRESFMTDRNCDPLPRQLDLLFLMGEMQDDYLPGEWTDEQHAFWGRLPDGPDCWPETYEGGWVDPCTGWRAPRGEGGGVTPEPGIAGSTTVQDAPGLSPSGESCGLMLLPNVEMLILGRLHRVWDAHWEGLQRALREVTRARAGVEEESLRVVDRLKSNECATGSSLDVIARKVAADYGYCMSYSLVAGALGLTVADRQRLEGFPRPDKADGVAPVGGPAPDPLPGSHTWWRAEVVIRADLDLSVIGGLREVRQDHWASLKRAWGFVRESDEEYAEYLRGSDPGVFGLVGYEPYSIDLGPAMEDSSRSLNARSRFNAVRAIVEAKCLAVDLAWRRRCAREAYRLVYGLIHDVVRVGRCEPWPLLKYPRPDEVQ